MSSWKRVAEERFPEVAIKEPVDLYIAAARKAIGGAVTFQAHRDSRHRGFIGMEIADFAEDAMKRASEDALTATAYSVGTRAFFTDAAANNEYQLYDLLLGEIETQYD